MKRVTAGVAVLSILTAACGEPSEEERAKVTNRAEQVAAEARAEIDALTARLGTHPVVQQDALVNCEFGQDDSGKYLLYAVDVTIQPGSLRRLKGEIADAYAADGWTVRQEDDGARFLKDRTSLGAHVYEDIGLARVGGSGGCSE